MRDEQHQRRERRTQAGVAAMPLPVADHLHQLGELNEIDPRDGLLRIRARLAEQLEIDLELDDGTPGREARPRVKKSHQPAHGVPPVAQLQTVLIIVYLY